MVIYVTVAGVIYGWLIYWMHTVVEWSSCGNVRDGKFTWRLEKGLYVALVYIYRLSGD